MKAHHNVIQTQGIGYFTQYTDLVTDRAEEEYGLVSQQQKILPLPHILQTTSEANRNSYRKRSLGLLPGVKAVEA
jgi:hypothetical protein